jgi:hypothetical protein
VHNKERLPSVRQKRLVVPRMMRAARSVEKSSKLKRPADKKSVKPVVLRDGPLVNGKRLNVAQQKRRKPSARNDVAAAKSGKRQRQRQRQQPMDYTMPTVIVVLAITVKPKTKKNAVAAGKQDVLPAKPS